MDQIHTLRPVNRQVIYRVTYQAIIHQVTHRLRDQRTVI